MRTAALFIAFIVIVSVVLAHEENALPIRSKTQKELKSTSGCPSGETQCSTSQGDGCCPASNACCCPDKVHCCKPPYQCGCTGTCPGSNCVCNTCASSGTCYSKLDF
mmetsp:Transcript_20800/g.29208  ORF Transcript_20800/g.29208 Transcript_20800/m.29208 type:complete len:107 (+) Transcript_20800:90-410(+)